MADNPRIDELRKRLEKEPGSRVFAQLAEELRKSGELGESIKVCRAGLEKQPGYWSARMTLGRALQESGDPAGARPEFEVVLKAAPDNILASRLLGECLEGTGDLAGAATRYRTTLTLAPGDKQVQSRLDAVEGLLKAPPPAATAVPLSPDAPIPLAAADDSFELEPAHAFGSPSVVEAEPESVLGRGAPDVGVPEGFPTEPAAPPAVSNAAETAPQVAPAAPAPAEFVEFDFDAGPPPSAPVPEPASVPAAAEPALASSTLAELYFNQGFTEKAIDVYRQVLEHEPANGRAQARLQELQALERHLKAEEERAPVAAAAASQDARAVRRAAIERTIARLEALLSAVRRD